MKNILFIISLIFLFNSCSKDEPKPVAVVAEKIPTWITVPYLEGGIAATRCVNASSSMSIDQSQTSALARAELARQIEVRSQVMDKTYQEKITTSKGDSIGSTFSEVSKQVAEANLNGSRPGKATYVTINGQKLFCTMMILDPNTTNQIIKNIISESGANSVNPQDKEVLYQEFKAYKAQQELEEAVSKN